MYELLGHKKYHKHLLNRMIAASKSEYLRKMNKMLLDLIERCKKDSESNDEYRYIGPRGILATPVLPNGGGYNLGIHMKAIPYLQEKYEYIKDQIQLLEDYDFMYDLGSIDVPN